MTDKLTFSIGGREVIYESRMMDIFQISFYEKNPRVATIVSENRGKVTEEIIDKCFWDKDETHKLKRRIEMDGGLIHPIVVYDGKVLEGNTRLCCYRHLYQETNGNRWKLIKSHVILDKLSEEDIYRLLCTEHITGKVEWDAYDKANMFCKMKDGNRMSLEQIEAIVGESTTSISYKIRAYKLMVEHGVINKNKYSHFEQMVTSGAIREIKKNQDPDIEKKVIKLIKDGTLKKATDMRSIGSIYKHKEARKRVFQNGENVEQVYHDLKAKAPMTDSPLLKEVESLTKRVNSLTREERDSIAKNKRDLSTIEKLTKEMLNLCREMGIKIYVPKNTRKG
jgi:hypothetical protein